MKEVAEWGLICVSAFTFLGGILSTSQIRNLLDRVVVFLPAVIFAIHFATRSVNRFASLWGVHAVWKLPIAALIPVVFPILAWLYLRRVERMCLRLIGLGLAAVLWSLSVGIVLSDWIAFPHPLEMLPPDLQGLDWVSIHHTPAIHHLYANATYLGFYVAAMIVLLWGRPFSAKLSAWMGSAKMLNIVSGLVLLVAIVIKVAF